MRIKAGETIIDGATVFSEKLWHEGASRPALRIELDGGLTDEQFAALTCGEIVLYEGEELLGIYTDYTAVARHEAVLVQMLDTQAAYDKGVTEGAAEATAELQTAFEAVIPSIADDAAAINNAMPLISDWTPGKYAVGDVRMFAGIPRYCKQTHDSTANPGWTPAAEPALWGHYHGTTPETARPFEADAANMYRPGEYITWDGGIKRCIEDTIYSPDELPSAWEDAN